MRAQHLGRRDAAVKKAARGAQRVLVDVEYPDPGCRRQAIGEIIGEFAEARDLTRPRLGPRNIEFVGGDMPDCRRRLREIKGLRNVCPGIGIKSTDEPLERAIAGRGQPHLLREQSELPGRRRSDTFIGAERDAAEPVHQRPDRRRRVDVVNTILLQIIGGRHQRHRVEVLLDRQAVEL